MAITDKVLRLPINDIKVDRENRQRKKIVTDDLERSIAKRGLLSPIIVDQNLELKAGERRLTACKNLGHETILARFMEDLDPTEAQIVELEENLKRQDLTWKEIIEAVGRIHGLYKAQDETWTGQQTGEEIGLAHNTISVYLRVFECFDDPRVQDSGTINEAYNKIKRRDQRLAGDALEELLGVADVMLPSEFAPSAMAGDAERLIEEVASVTAAAGMSLAPLTPRAKQMAEPEVIVEANFLEWALTYEGPKFNFVHCDFPYGINLFAGPQGRSGASDNLYADSPDIYWALLNCLLDNLDNFLSLSGHLMFWYSEKFGAETRKLFAEKAPSLKFTTHPLIWFKSDKAGIASDPRFTPRHIYETCLLARRSDRNLRMVKGDAYSSPTDNKLHVSAKPEPMLREFMEMIVDETTSILDPTCGSGSSLRAADSLGAKRLLGLEVDPKTAGIARQAFKNARLLRSAATHL